MRTTLANMLGQQPFWRNVGILASGTVAAQLVMVLALPLLTRLYSPSDFNLLAVFASTLGLLTVASCLRFNIAIPIAEDDESGINLLILALLAGVFVAALVAIPVLMAPEWAAGLLRQPGIAPYLWLLPVGLLFAAAYDALQYWATRKQRFVVVSQTRLTRAIGGVGTQLGTGVAGVGPFGLITGHVMLSGFGSVGLFRSVLKHDGDLLGTTSIQKLKATAAKYRNFPFYSVPESLFNTAGLEISIIVIAAYSSGPEAGFLMLAMRVIGIPMSFVGTSVAQVWLTDAPLKLRQGELASFTKKTMAALVKAGAPVMLVAGVSAPLLFPFVFGAEWGQAGVILTWLAPMFLLQFIASPISALPHVLDRIKWAMWLQGTICIIRLCAIAIASQLSPQYLVEVFALTGALCYGATIALFSRLAQKAVGQK